MEWCCKERGTKPVCLMTSSMKSTLPLLATRIITMERDGSHGSFTFQSLSSFEPVPDPNNFKKELWLPKHTIVLNASTFGDNLHDSHNVLDFLYKLLPRKVWTNEEPVHGQPKKLQRSTAFPFDLISPGWRVMSSDTPELLLEFTLHTHWS